LSAAQAADSAAEAADIGGVPEAPTDGKDYLRRGSEASWFPLTATLTLFTPVGNISSTTVQAAIAELESEKVSKAGDTLTGPLLMAAGTNLAPSYAFSLDTQLGWYRSASNTMALTVNGTQRLTIDTSAIATTLKLTLPNSGTAANAMVNFGTAGTGVYGDATTVRLTTSNTLRFTVDTTLISATLPIGHSASGTAAATQVHFGTAGTGIYGDTTSVKFSTSGTLRLTIDTANVTTTLPVVHSAAGTAAATQANFGTAGTGVYGDSTSVRISTSATLRLTVDTTLVTSTLPIVLPADPASNLHAAPKQYIDNKLAGKITVAASAPGSPATNDLWVDTT
jgi:hypothetical protein